MQIKLSKSNRKNKKYKVVITDGERTKTVHFGAEGYSDFTKHKDTERKKRYIARHQKRENWNKSGIYTAGFWSRWLLWNKPTIEESIKDIEKRFKVSIQG